MLRYHENLGAACLLQRDATIGEGLPAGHPQAESDLSSGHESRSSRQKSNWESSGIIPLPGGGCTYRAADETPPRVPTPLSLQRQSTLANPLAAASPSPPSDVVYGAGVAGVVMLPVPTWVVAVPIRPPIAAITPWRLPENAATAVPIPTVIIPTRIAYSSADTPSLALRKRRNRRDAVVRCMMEGSLNVFCVKPRRQQ